MRRTFKGWLLRYCQQLTGLKTTSVKKLVRLVERNAPHAAETVCLYALAVGRASDLVRHSASESLWAGCRDVAEMLSAPAAKGERAFEEALRCAYGNLPPRFRKVVDLYDSLDADAANDLRVKAQMAQRVLAALDRAGCTRYRLCRDLGLNEGNVYAWLAGDATKVSRATARKAWKYAESLR